ncbi:hypothetical protein HG536_0H01810 [Torulaspora globosa]|uniref:Sodium/calcium exchanger membrane region domain-containing protein n=1 Tax=Torulaspora globosa TaxID=48254 RepID=A0A7G3ZMS0_9SACH|nr:uncharacterized protein HG536_0H01810 [Torulaspora globosa]QLL34806.1 hypothetical protein HG536_0H01810 [Torulaspora globosa]
MQLVLRRLTAALFYLASLALIAYAFHNGNLKTLYLEPLLLLECFIALGLIASDFLTASLSHISSNILQISDRVSGLTLLALGNAVPDITSTYQSMNAGATALALGELFGGIFFLLTVVLGSMALVRPVKLCPPQVIRNLAQDLEHNLKFEEGTILYSRAEFIQDISIFAGLVLLSAIFLADGHLMFWECAVMVLLYCIYAAYLVLYHKGPVEDTDQDALFETGESASDLSTVISNTERACQHEGNITLFNNGIQERRANIRRRIRSYLRSNYNGWVRITLRDCLDIWENEGRLQSPEPPTEENQGFLERPSLDDSETSPLVRRASSLQDVRQLPSVHVFEEQASPPASSSRRLAEDDSLLGVYGRPFTQKSLSCDHIPGVFSSVQGCSNLESQLVPSQEPTIRTWPRDFKLFAYLTDCNMCLPTTEYIALLFTTPVAFTLCLLIPYLHHKNGNGSFHAAEILRLTLLPYVLSFLLSDSTSLPHPYWLFGLSLTLFCILTYRKVRSISRYNASFLAIAGFISCISIICFCVHIVVMTLTDWADNFNISGSILGLTVFAWGNSLGDLVSNVVFVQIGILDLALGACFGSPLLYFVFGVGIDGMLLILKSRKSCDKPLYACQIDYEPDSSLGFSGLGIVLAFLIFAVAVPLNHWQIDGKISMLLLVLYAAVNGYNVLQELF